MIRYVDISAGYPMLTPPFKNSPDASMSGPPAPLSGALEMLRIAEQNLERRIERVMSVSVIAQTTYCFYLLVKWLCNGHYIWGPIGAVLIWSLLLLGYFPLSLLWYPRKRALKKALSDVDAARIEAGGRFLAAQSLGSYRWVCLGGRMIGLFPNSGMLYVLAPEFDNCHLLTPAIESVRQVLVDERAVTTSFTETTTKHGLGAVFAPNSIFGVISMGDSHGTSTTTQKTERTFTLHMQLQSDDLHVCWVHLPFSEDWQEARNWQLLIEQAAGVTS